MNRKQLKDGLSDTELYALQKKLKLNQKVHVIMSNEIYKLERSVRQNKNDTYMFIINTDSSDKLGSHWQSWYINKKNKKIYFYDSLNVGKPDKEILKEIRGLFGTGYKVYYNRDQDQSSTSGTCGYYALAFLQNMHNGISFRKASDLTEDDIYDWFNKNF
jgi:hypothetical protein